MVRKAYTEQAINTIQQHIGSTKCNIGIILGSGLDSIALALRKPKIIPYDEIPGFPGELISGQKGQVIVGHLGENNVVCLQGRAHLYQGGQSHVIKTMIRTLKRLGCRSVILTNAAGTLNPKINIGELMLVTDHINFQITNPLVGPNDDEYGPRFIDLSNAYDEKLRSLLLTSAKTEKITLHQGIYVATLGPCLETPAEIRAFRTLGGDVIGMSTVSETIVARHCGLRVAAISVITNYAAGMSKEKLTHERVVAEGQAASESLKKLLYYALENYHG